jgi:hypothetical protein
VSRLAMEKSTATVIVKGRTDLMNPVKLDDIVIMSDGVVREVHVYQSSATVQTPGCIYVTKSKVGEIESVKFVLSPTAATAQSNSEPFFHSEGGVAETPVTLRTCSFTTTSGSVGSLTYSVIEVVDGWTLIIGCTFSDLKMNPMLTSDTAVVSVKDASITLKNSVLSNIQLDTSAAVLGGASSQCEWGSYSVIVLRETVSSIKDVIVSNTYAGVVVHGGTAVIEGTSFTSVGTETNVKYPSVERHVRCGMESIFFVYHIKYKRICIYIYIYIFIFFVN